MNTASFDGSAVFDYAPDGGKRKWASDAERLTFLFRRYRELTSFLPGEAENPKAARSRARRV